jgi:hypothetical protein
VGAYTALLYLIYLGLAVAGLLAWRKAIEGRDRRPGGPADDPGPPGGRAVPGSAP